MSEEEKGKTEETLESVSEDVGKIVKKGWGVAKDLGKAFMKGVEGDGEKKEDK
jgi:hypothetical protein